MLKKNGKLICVDFKKLNKPTKKGFYPWPFFNEVLNIVSRYEAYSFLDRYSSYHHIFKMIEDRYKTTFVIDRGAFFGMVMPFGVKNGPLTFQKVVNRAFSKYLD